jgi:hypothetical protein
MRHHPVLRRNMTVEERVQYGYPISHTEMNIALEREYERGREDGDQEATTNCIECGNSECDLLCKNCWSQ